MLATASIFGKAELAAMRPPVAYALCQSSRRQPIVLRNALFGYPAFQAGERLVLEETELAEFIAGTARRESEAFRSLYDETSALLLGIALKVLGRRDLAEEAVQDAYVTIWRQAARFDPSRGSARGWIAVIARRRAVDRLRASPWLRREIPDEEEFSASVESLPETMTLRHCLEQLEAQSRHAIYLAYVYGMTHSELSRKTGTPLGTMKSRLRRGLHALRECLGQ